MLTKSLSSHPVGVEASFKNSVMGKVLANTIIRLSERPEGLITFILGIYSKHDFPAY